jgi:hypothetical protein
MVTEKRDEIVTGRLISDEKLRLSSARRASPSAGGCCRCAASLEPSGLGSATDFLDIVS